MQLLQKRPLAGPFEVDRATGYGLYENLT